MRRVSFWGAHAPRVPVAAPRRDQFRLGKAKTALDHFSGTNPLLRKFALARAPAPAREARALPRRWPQREVLTFICYIALSANEFLVRID